MISLNHRHADSMPVQPRHLFGEKQKAAVVAMTAVPVVARQQEQIDLLFDGEVDQLHEGSARRVGYFMALLAGARS
jgi:hypothetical protein